MSIALFCVCVLVGMVFLYAPSRKRRQGQRLLDEKRADALLWELLKDEDPQWLAAMEIVAPVPDSVALLRQRAREREQRVMEEYHRFNEAMAVQAITSRQRSPMEAYTNLPGEVICAPRGSVRYHAQTGQLEVVVDRVRADYFFC